MICYKHFGGIMFNIIENRIAKIHNAISVKDIASAVKIETELIKMGVAVVRKDDGIAWSLQTIVPNKATTIKPG
jgi:hypothetical protein